MAGEVTSAKLVIEAQQKGVENVVSALGRLEKHLSAINKNIDAMNKALLKLGGGQAAGIDKATAALKKQEDQAKKTGDALEGAADAGAGGGGGGGGGPGGGGSRRGRGGRSQWRRGMAGVPEARWMGHAYADRFTGVTVDTEFEARARAAARTARAAERAARFMGQQGGTAASAVAAGATFDPAGARGFGAGAAYGAFGVLPGALAPTQLAGDPTAAAAWAAARAQGRAARSAAFGATRVVPDRTVALAIRMGQGRAMAAAMAAGVPFSRVMTGQLVGQMGQGAGGLAAAAMGAAYGAAPGAAAMGAAYGLTPGPLAAALGGGGAFGGPIGAGVAMGPRPGILGGLAGGVAARRLARGVMGGPAGLARAGVALASSPLGWAAVGAYGAYHFTAGQIGKGLTDAERYEEFLRSTRGLTAWTPVGQRPEAARNFLRSEARHWSEQTGFGLAETTGLFEEAQGAYGGMTPNVALRGSRTAEVWSVAAQAAANFGLSPGVTGRMARAFEEDFPVSPTRRKGGFRRWYAGHIAGATALGLGGPRLGRYFGAMEEAAETGLDIGAMPHDRGLAIGIGMGRGGLGMGPERALRFGRRMQAGMVGLSRAGAIQSPFDIYSIATLGGLDWNKRGGFGAEDVLAAQGRLEKGVFGPDQARAFAGGAYRMAGGGAAGTMMMRLAFAQRGADIGVDEAKKLAGWLATSKGGGGAIPGDVQSILARLEGTGVAKGMVPESLKRAAGREGAEVLDTGRRLSETAQNFKDAAAKLTEGVNDLTSGPIKRLSEALDALAGGFERAVKRGQVQPDYDMGFPVQP